MGVLRGSLDWWLIVLLGFLAVEAKIEYRHHNNIELQQILESINDKCKSVTHLYYLKSGDVSTTADVIFSFGKDR